MNYFDHNTPTNQRKPEPRAPKREYAASMALRAPHKTLSESELAVHLRAAISQNKRSR